MCLVIFAWLVIQPYFKEMTDNDIRKRIYDEQKNQIDRVAVGANHSRDSGGASKNVLHLAPSER
jgi:hypothetical protein